MVSRADRSPFAEWWWTVDKVLLGALVVLMLVGIVLSLAGSPAVAERLGYESFHFVKRHLGFFLPALAVLIATSFLSPRQARRAALAWPWAPSCGWSGRWDSGSTTVSSAVPGSTTGSTSSGKWSTTGTPC